MGFADYLSRHPKQQPTPPSADDIQYLVNLINDFKFILTQISINQNSATRNNSDKYQTNYLTANNSTHAYNYHSAFCLNPSIVQPLSFSYSNSSNSLKFTSKHIDPNKNVPQSIRNSKPQGFPPKFTSVNSVSFKNSEKSPRGYQTIQVTTRSRPKLNTFEQKIIKRKRAPNKKNQKLNSDKITIATQTDEHTNKGLKRTAVRPDPLNPIYPLSSAAEMPQYRKNLNQVFGEEFVAEATQKKQTSGSHYKTN